MNLRRVSTFVSKRGRFEGRGWEKRIKKKQEIGNSSFVLDFHVFMECAKRNSMKIIRNRYFESATPFGLRCAVSAYNIWRS